MAVQKLYYSNNVPSCKVNLKDLKLNHDSCGYYLSAIYKIDDEDSIRELDIPKIRLKVDPHRVDISIDAEVFGERKANIGFGWCDIYHDGTKDEVYLTERILHQKVHEMTMEELEKLLGYKVKIISKEERIFSKKEKSEYDWLRSL